MGFHCTLVCVLSRILAVKVYLGLLEYPPRELHEWNSKIFSKLLPSKLVPFDIESLFETTDDGVLSGLFLEGGEQSPVALHKFCRHLTATSKRKKLVWLGTGDNGSL